MLKSSILAGASLFALASGAVAADQKVTPRFVVMHSHDPAAREPGKAALPTWTFKWTYKNGNYSAIFVGKDVSTGKGVTVPVYIIPMKLTVNGTVADPTAPDYTGNSPVQNMVASPIFQSLDYKQAGVDVGNTQYEDAFQRANLWGTVSSKPNYHVLLGTPTVEPVQSYTVPPGYGTVGTPIKGGATVLEVDINWFDNQAEALLTKLKLPVNSLPIFTITQTYLTSGGCCIGGYHNYTGKQAYSVYTYISNSGTNVDFSQDVSALSHEVGEWLDDPFTNNSHIPAACSEDGSGNSIYEVGDPLEGDANYGTYQYVLGGFTYHLQDLTLPTYFGAPATTSVPGLNQTFQGTKLAVCINGG